MIFKMFWPRNAYLELMAAFRLSDGGASSRAKKIVVVPKKSQKLRFQMYGDLHKNRADSLSI